MGGDLDWDGHGDGVEHRLLEGAAALTVHPVPNLEPNSLGVTAVPALGGNGRSGTATPLYSRVSTFLPFSTNRPRAEVVPVEVVRVPPTQ